MKSLERALCDNESNERIVAIHNAMPITLRQFRQDVASLCGQLSELPQQRWTLYEESSYAFAVGFFALLHSGKSVLIPGNDTPQTLLALQHESDGWLGSMPNATLTIKTFTDKALAYAFTPIKLCNKPITIFTSGSTGQPKAIHKSLAQFNAEITSLETGFGTKMGKAHIIATVSHQHIYGFIFRILWPIACGRVFHDTRALDSALVLKQIIENTPSAVWIASPAHLKRLHHLLPWQLVKPKLNAIFSSGGPLPHDAAGQLHEWLGESAIEVFGSSETGGIAWRQQYSSQPLWHPLPDVHIKTDKEQRLWVLSAHININEWYATDDSAHIENDAFTLLGRLDRIVKLEEKRLSLVEMEQKLQAHEWVNEAYCLLLPPENSHRELLAAVIILNTEGQRFLQKQGKSLVTQHLKHLLLDSFELSLLPRKWRFIEQLPMNTQAKIDTPAVQGLFAHHD